MKACVRGIFGYGLDKITTVKDLVFLVQRTYMSNLKYLLTMADTSAIRNFPVTQDQLRKHYVELDAWVLSHMRMRNTNLRGLRDPQERREITENSRRLTQAAQDKDRSTHTITDDEALTKGPETFKPGYRAHTDLKEFMGQYMVLFRDHATGFLKGYNLASGGKKQVALAAQNYFMLNIGKNHRVKEMVSDKEAVFSALQHTILQTFQVSAIQSAPYNKHLNGRIERASYQYTPAHRIRFDDSSQLVNTILLDGCISPGNESPQPAIKSYTWEFGHSR